MAQVNVEKLDRKALRNMATDLGVKWDKRVDDEASLKKKVRAKLEAATVEEKSETQFDVSARDPVETYIDPLTKKEQKRPAGCFGWLYSDDPKEPCAKSCPHAKKCKVLTASAGEAMAQLEAEEEDEAEADAITDEDVKLVEEANKKRAAKAAKKGAESEPTIAKGEERKGALTEKTKLVVEYDLDWALSVEDDTLRKFFKRIVKKHGEGTAVAASALIDEMVDIFGEDDRETLLNDLLTFMVSEGNFKRA